MSDSEQLKFEFSQTGWRQSIAVNIAAQIIWVIVPIIFISSVFLFNEIEKDQSTIQSYKTDALNYRVSNIVLHNPRLSKIEKDTIISKIAEELDFQGIQVNSPSYQLSSNNIPDGYLSVTSTLPITSGDNNDNPFIVIKAYHAPLDQLLIQKRKNILAVILIILVIFSIFLVFSIRTWIYKPLKTIVDATESVASGEKKVTLDTNRNDEFGHLSLFFQHMLDNLNIQHDKLRTTAKLANEASSAKSLFLANMSHELRTPLNAIIGYSEMMLDVAKENNDKIYIDDLGKTISASKHLLNLINEVLDLSKIEAGKMEVHYNNIDIISLIREISTTIEPLTKQRNNVLKVEYEINIERIYSDIMKIRQLLINLLGNACKFTENGLITLKVTHDIKNDNIVFSVKDTGIGIKQESLKTLFMPFVQEDNSSTRMYSGTGLGLAICSKLANMLGGDITVKSAVGKGSCFTLTLPVHANYCEAFNTTEDLSLTKQANN